MTDSFEAVVIGSGFGGAVTACRLVEAGFKTCVLERGRRYGPHDFPVYPAEHLFVHEDVGDERAAPPPDFSRWLWDRDYGLYDIQDLGDAVVVQASGFGGGSLVYANVHLRPPSDAFAHHWPAPYAPESDAWTLAPYFDLAAYMLRAEPIPQRLAKTTQLARAADATGARGGFDSWFRLPLAVSFAHQDVGLPQSDEPFTNPFNRQQQHCDMRGRCWLGCDRQAKNTLDLNYLARAEDDSLNPVHVRTMSDVTTIERLQTGRFRVTYRNLLVRDEHDIDATEYVDADVVFLCAGSIGTTRLLFESPTLFPGGVPGDAVGSHYFTNSGSLAAVFDCDQPHEADFGPTITSAILFRRDAEGRHSQSLDFSRGSSYPSSASPREGMRVKGETSGATAVLAHDPLLDWGSWVDGTAAGCLVVTDTKGDFRQGERLVIGGGAARARARSAVITHRHWFMAQDGGYPPDLEPLVGIFRSPLWARRNRFLEVPAHHASSAPPGRQLRVHALADAMSGVPTSDLLETEVRDLLPRWLVRALDDSRKEFVSQAAAAFLPMLGRLLDELSVTLADQASADILERLRADVIGGPRKEVLVRGMLRQALQVLAGSEVTLANKAAEVFTSGLPLSPEKLLQALGRVVLWALAYGSVDRHTALLLTMGRDPYRGRLEYTPSHRRSAKTIRAHLPVVLERPSALFQERVLRTIARDGWKGELRTSPAWVPLETHLTVHSQGGCPMGTDAAFSVTDPWGEVHGSPGLYVMDAAAFPTSVGVNPSASITAVAELKIEHFIRNHGRSGWQARDMEAAVAWADQRRDRIDPLGEMRVFTREPAAELLGLQFREQMYGFSGSANDAPADWTELEADPVGRGWERFRQSEEDGMRQGRTVFARLRVRAVDLAELVASTPTTDPVRMAVTGRVDLRNRRAETLQRLRTTDRGRSYVQFFAAAPTAAASRGDAARYFRYELELTDGRHRYHLRGRKVLRNDRGTDVWSDTATLYFELEGPDVRERGILRLSLADFARRQLPSMTITGTTDPARRSWALLAFYKYFASGLSEVYAARADRLVALLLKSVTTIHV